MQIATSPPMMNSVTQPPAVKLLMISITRITAQIADPMSESNSRLNHRGSPRWISQ